MHVSIIDKIDMIILLSLTHKKMLLFCRKGQISGQIFNLILQFLFPQVWVYFILLSYLI